MSKRRKPLMSLAAAMHRITPNAVAPAPAVAAAAAAAADGQQSARGKKRPRQSNAQLISAFHVLQREQGALAAAKATLTPAAYAAQHAALEARLAELGGLDAYQRLSIAGQSNSKYSAFNTSHWVVDTLASYPQFANLKQFAGRRAASGGAEGTGAAPDLERKMARRQKERERKRLRKKQKLIEEQQAAKAAAGGKAGKGTAKGAAASAKGKQAQAQQAAASDDEEAEDELREEDGESSGGEGEEEESGDARSSASAAASAAAAAATAAGPLFSSENKVRLLDVGAITNHYLPYASQISSMAIDLNPQHPSVTKADFFSLDHTGALRASFDVVVLSLVLNFVGDRFQRGEMIKRSAKMLRQDGLGRLFIILPSACLKNSRWMSHESFVDKCMRPLGLQLAQWKYSTKLAFFEFIKSPPTAEDLEAEAEAAAAKAKAKAGESDEAAAQEEEEEEPEAAAASDDEGAPKKPVAAAAKKPVAPIKKKRKGFQPAGIVLEGETRNNFSIAWRAD